MIDIHCHILPNLDDGAGSLEESLDMCRIAVKDGVKTIVATPHQQNGVYQNSSKGILNAVTALRATLKKEQIPLELLPGADVHIDVDTAEKILAGEIMTVNNNQRYFLLEFPAHSIPPNIEKLIFNLVVKNIIPILTHPERIAEVQEHPNRIYDIVAMGVLSQITAMSITGGFGSRAQKCAKTLLKHNLAHIIASDAHSKDYRPPILSEAVNVVSRMLGEERALEMVETFPQQVIRGEPVYDLPPPLKIQRKLFWFF